MYLSKLDINRGRIAYDWLAQPYRIHQRLCMAAGDDPRLLFRIELPEHVQRDGAHILVQTVEAPDWSAAFGEFPVLNGEVLCKKVAYDLHEGQMLTFRLRANPTARRRLEDGSKKRIGLIKEDEQRVWLRRKAESGGFQIVHVWVHQDQAVQAKIHDKEQVHSAKLVAVQFEGVLRVADPERLRQTLVQGIGSGKGLGFGLLSIARARS